MGSITESQFDAAVEGGIEMMRQLEEAKEKSSATQGHENEDAAAIAAPHAGPSHVNDELVVVIPASATAGQFFPLDGSLAARLPRVEIGPGLVAVPGFIIKEGVSSSSRDNVVVLQADPDVSSTKKEMSSIPYWMLLASFFVLLLGLSVVLSRV